MIVYSFMFFLFLFVIIGVASSLKSKGSNSDYLLAGQDVPPWLAALSAVATNNSGYMFIGMIGFTYTSGLQSIWLMIGWIFGDLMMSAITHKKVREISEKRELLSFGGLLARWQKNTDFKKLRFLAGAITIAFLGVYAAAQFKAGSKALHVLFGWDYSTGAIIGSVMVFLYCLSGGIRASIWTDAAQSFVMIFAMTMLLIVSVNNYGGIDGFVSALQKVAPGYLDFTPTGLEWQNNVGILLFILGWFFGGFGIAGQPHIMVRFMTINDSKNMGRTKLYYYSWYLSFWLITIGVGLAARLILPNVQGFDPELALPMISQELLPQILVGVVLAGIFAATMSTADSQILSCSAALTRDLAPGKKISLMGTKIATGVFTLLALGIALFGESGVFDLVIIAWSVFSATFAPIIFLFAIGKKISEKTAISMMVVALLTILVWRTAGLSGSMFDAAPGIVSAMLVYFLLKNTSFNKLEA